MDALVLWLAVLGAGGPSVGVSEFFTGLPLQRKCCVEDDYTRFESEMEAAEMKEPLPWHGTGSSMLRSSLFSLNAIFNASNAHCGDDLVAPAGAAPSDLCAHSAPPRTMLERGRNYDQYAHERIMISRALDAGAETCDPNVGCAADVVVIESLALHLHVRFGFYWKYFFCHGSDLHRAYWDRVRRAYWEPRKSRPPLIVMHMSSPWDLPDMHRSFTAALADQPAAFRASLVITAHMSMLPAVKARLPNPSRWDDDPFAELAAREARPHEPPAGPLVIPMPAFVAGVHPPRLAARAPVPRRVAVLNAASVARDADKSHAGGHQFVRRDITRAMGRAGAVCVADSGTCMLCALPGANETGAGIGGCAQSVRGGDPLFTPLVHSTFCLELPGDTAYRSHIYLAIVAGCIPVIVDGGHSGYNLSRPTLWPWRSATRQDAREPERSATGPELRQGWPAALRDGLDYSRFAIVLSAADVIQLDSQTAAPIGERGDARWLQELRALASAGLEVNAPRAPRNVGSQHAPAQTRLLAQRLAALRTELKSVAPLFTYARWAGCRRGQSARGSGAASDGGGSWDGERPADGIDGSQPCDAFSFFQLLLARGWHSHRAYYDALASHGVGQPAAALLSAAASNYGACDHPAPPLTGAAAVAQARSYLLLVYPMMPADAPDEAVLKQLRNMEVFTMMPSLPLALLPPLRPFCAGGGGCSSPARTRPRLRISFHPGELLVAQRPLDKCPSGELRACILRASLHTPRGWVESSEPVFRRNDSIFEVLQWTSSGKQLAGASPRAQPPESIDASPARRWLLQARGSGVWYRTGRALFAPFKNLLLGELIVEWQQRSQPAAAHVEPILEAYGLSDPALAIKRLKRTASGQRMCVAFGFSCRQHFVINDAYDPLLILLGRELGYESLVSTHTPLGLRAGWFAAEVADLRLPSSPVFDEERYNASSWALPGRPNIRGRPFATQLAWSATQTSHWLAHVKHEQIFTLRNPLAQTSGVRVQPCELQGQPLQGHLRCANRRGL
jgi:hypothetical protein